MSAVIWYTILRFAFVYGLRSLGLHGLFIVLDVIDVLENLLVILSRKDTVVFV